MGSSFFSRLALHLFVTSTGFMGLAVITGFGASTGSLTISGRVAPSQRLHMNQGTLTAKIIEVNNVSAAFRLFLHSANGGKLRTSDGRLIRYRLYYNERPIELAAGRNITLDHGTHSKGEYAHQLRIEPADPMSPRAALSDPPGLAKRGPNAVQASQPTDTLTFSFAAE